MAEGLSAYRLLSKEQQGSLQLLITDKIRALLEVHGGGDIAVLVEYIAVMLASDKHRDLIEQELEAFLQDQSKPFVTWLTKKLEALMAGDDEEPELPIKPKSSKEAKDEGRPPAKKQRASTGGDSAKSSKIDKASKDGPGKISKALGKKRPGGLLGNLFGRAVKDAQRSAGPDGEASKEAASPAAKEKEPSAKAASPPRKSTKRAAVRTRSRSERPRKKATIKTKSKKPPPPEEDDDEGSDASECSSREKKKDKSKAVLQENAGVRGRAGTFGAAVAAAQSTSGSSKSSKRVLAAAGTPAFHAPPPRPWRAPPATPPPRSTMPASEPAASSRRRKSKTDRGDGGAGIAAAATAAAAADCASSTGAAKLSPAQPREEHEDDRWHFQAAAPSPAVGHPGMPPHGHPMPPHGHPMPPYLGYPHPGYPGWPHPMIAPGHPLAIPGPRPPMPAAVAAMPAQAAPAAAAAQPAAHPAVARSAPPRPKNFVPQKWRVARDKTVVRSAEHLESQEVRVLNEGEIVESVGPPFTLPNGIVRLQIAHPSSAAYPNPIGWVTRDATACGGPRYLEPGPQPVGAGARPPRPAYGGGKGAWRPRADHTPRPFRPRSATFGNITWRPTAA